MDHRDLATAAVRAIADHFGAVRSGARVPEQAVTEIVAVVSAACGIGSPIIGDLRRYPGSSGVRNHAVALLSRALNEDERAGPALGEALGRSA